MANTALFVTTILPYLQKITKKTRKPKSTEYDVYQLRRKVSDHEIKSSYLAKDDVINWYWDKMYYEFQKLNIHPSHYAQYRDPILKDGIVLELRAREKKK